MHDCRSGNTAGALGACNEKAGIKGWRHPRTNVVAPDADYAHIWTSDRNPTSFPPPNPSIFSKIGLSGPIGRHSFQKYSSPPLFRHLHSRHLRQRTSQDPLLLIFASIRTDCQAGFALAPLPDGPINYLVPEWSRHACCAA